MQFSECRNCGTPIKSKYGYCQRSAECRRLYGREQARQFDKAGRRRAYQQGWYAANRERILAQQKEYNAANPEKLREYGRRWRAANPGYNQKRLTRPGRICRVKGCDELAVDRLLYCRPHAQEQSRRRDKQRRRRTAQRLYDLQQGVCPDADHGGCGQPLGPLSACHIDHLVPVALGGPEDNWNLQLMHDLCNRVKQHRIVPAASALLAKL